MRAYLKLSKGKWEIKSTIKNYEKKTTKSNIATNITIRNKNKQLKEKTKWHFKQ